MEPILIYDTTLRDGTQGENINFSAEEKIEIAHRLDDIGIHYIEGGWPGSNPRDMQFFDIAKRTSFKNARITSFGSTRRPGINVSKDRNLKALLESDAPTVAIVGKSWDLHVEKIMGIGLEENLEMICQSIEYMKKHDREVVYDAEHFFDGYIKNPAYALKTLNAAINGGADIIVLCDTNGGTLPFDVESVIKETRNAIDADQKKQNRAPLIMGIHTHNDSNMAVANSIAAVRSGACLVQGTINGYGERCGNADLTSVIPILCLKMDRQCIAREKLSKLKNVSRFISETANMIPRNSRPFVGNSAFAHKGGIHVNAIMKQPIAYEHVNPEIVGNKRRVLVSDLSGKSNIEYKARELAVNIETNGVDPKKIVDEIKNLEHEGYQYDTADGSFKILLEKFTKQFEPLFELESFRISVEKDKEQPCKAHATIKISVGNDIEITAAEGKGPVSALDNALRKALGKFFSADLDMMRLVDFKVRVIDGRDGTEAKVRVLIDSRDQTDIWSTVGVSEDIIEASWQALSDSFQYKLSKDKQEAGKETLIRT